MGPSPIHRHAAFQEPLLETEPQEVRTDQRSRGRYPISLELQYKLFRGDEVQQTGMGRTLNISSTGVLFETQDRLPAHGQVEVSMQWPFLLQGVCGLKLVMRGRIVRSLSQHHVTAVRAESHEFRTAGIRRVNAAHD